MDLPLLRRYLPSSPSLALLTIASATIIIYVFIISIYRLYFHPIAHFPGPKLAGLTRWYEFYYELVKKGQMTFHIQELHKKYGPIVRVTPNELHVLDSDYFEELYVKSGKLDKYAPFSARFGTDDTFFTAPSHEYHRRLRNSVAPYFSKRKIMDFQPVIRAKLDTLCSKIAEYAGTDRVLPLHRAWTALTGDVVTEFCFAKAYHHLDSPDFEETFHEPMHAACESSSVLMQFPWLWPIMNSLPDWLVVRVEPKMHMHIQVQHDFERTISALKQTHDETHKSIDHATLFHEMLNSDLSPNEKSVSRMVQEAQVIIGAAILTTSWAAAVASFHIINNLAIFRKLRAELEEAIPDPNAKPDWQNLEQLPYLNGCIKEGIRLAYGIASRLPRVARTELKYKEWTIPAGTPVSMTIVDMNHDEEVFPQSQSFIPERWLNNPTTKDGQSLERYFVGFGKGARSCIGLNLAQAELYMGLATVFRKFSFELYDTDVSDTILAHDYFVPTVKLDTKGIRVKVKSVEK
ncbi:hypothetical protein LTR99_008070 [Exophiala xenobiotica]|uniref:Cytochrome P450 n=1 Tax=Vermiconidia calcicola TaxID=1690605 RepID=A0AAV9QI19_9PEZI|nr:hypothetical protein LTR92_003665 [Exophiala xenobiotica]KAK5543390.1 hypothetical protein LTR25_001003 [Vermiconidia calcicola]KAK5544313.1 hypothetical protein LTR23_004692 [Chaetothyriales sp. CCFEE 6169]KAK5266073.1 hypothetical protein LTR96_008467 [Exophiala xenobiotica]KAK5297668.1 hypothetical protein LTR99_008070 [Exophiala xenobiotica]